MMDTPDNAPGKGRSLSQATKVRIVVFSTTLLIALVIFVYFQGERQLAAEHDRIVQELVVTGEYRQAAEALEPLVARAGFVVRPQMRQTLALCYAGVGDDPSLSLAESAEWYRKAKAIDPDLIHEQRQRVIDTAGSN